MSDKVIIQIVKGKGVDITNTMLIQDYLKLGTIPSSDALLDWRLYLMNRLETNKEFPDEWFEREIIATDYLLNELLNKNSK